MLVLIKPNERTDSFLLGFYIISIIKFVSGESGSEVINEDPIRPNLIIWWLFRTHVGGEEARVFLSAEKKRKWKNMNEPMQDQLLNRTRPRVHTLISPFETPARIICETINPVPLLRMFFGGRRHGNDFLLPGNATLRLFPSTRTQRRRKTEFVLYNCMNDEYVLLLPGDDFLCWNNTTVTRAGSARRHVISRPGQSGSFRRYSERRF